MVLPTNPLYQVKTDPLDLPPTPGSQPSSLPETGSPTLPPAVQGQSTTTTATTAPTMEEWVNSLGGLDVLYQNAVQGGSGTSAGLNWIRRPGPMTATEVKTPGVGPSSDFLSHWTGWTLPRATEQEYLAEYWEKAIKDPTKKQWLAERALVLQFTKYDPNGQFGVSNEAFTNGGILQMWNAAGLIVRMNPTLNKMTPEEYIDSVYNSMGGDAALAALKEQAVENPISTLTQRHTITISQVQADAVADQMAMALLGHMASPAEMKRARGVMNSVLKANPTVSTTTTDRTNPNAVTSTTHTKEGASASDAAAAYEMKLRRSSEGMAFGAGKLIEDAMAMLDRGL